jgi:hypothetical protein
MRLSNKPFHLTPTSLPSVAPTRAGERQRCADASARRASYWAPWSDSGAPCDLTHAGRYAAASHRPGGATPSAHRGGGTGAPRAGAARAAHPAAGAGAPLAFGDPKGGFDRCKE